MFHVFGSAPQHFWLSEGHLTPLLHWESGELGSKFTLLGKAYGNPHTGNQWFDQIVVEKDATPVLDMSIDGAGQEQGSTKPEASFKHAEAAGADTAIEIGADRRSASVQAGGLRLNVQMTNSTKFASQAAQFQHRHLNVKFTNAIPAGATGVFAELAGVQPMSEATTALLKPVPTKRQPRHLALQP